MNDNNVITFFELAFPMIGATLIPKGRYTSSGGIGRALDAKMSTIGGLYLDAFLTEIRQACPIEARSQCLPMIAFPTTVGEVRIQAGIVVPSYHNLMRVW